MAEDTDDLLRKVSKVLGPTDLCPKCGSNEHLERRNYDMMWGEAELWCGRCDVFIRDLDYG